MNFKKWCLESILVVVCVAVVSMLHAEEIVDNTGAVNTEETIQIPDNTGEINTQEAVQNDVADETKKMESDNSIEENVVVENGKTVKVDYSLTVDGELIDSSNGGEPITFEIGANQMIPGFEKALIGMKVGEKKSFELAPEDGYGMEDPKLFQEVPKDKLPPELEPAVGLVLYVKGQDGRPNPIKIAEVKDDTVILNFNNPLAGKTLNFDVEVTSVE